MKTTMRANKYALTLILLLMIPVLLLAQDKKKEMVFFKMNETVGYVIDFEENLNHNCFPFIPKNIFSYAALVQLPDSNIALRVKLSTKNTAESFYQTIYLSESEVDSLFTDAGLITTRNPKYHNKKEYKLMQTLLLDSDTFHLLPYDQLKFNEKKWNEVPVSETTSAGIRRKLKKSFLYLNLGYGRGGFRKYYASAAAIDLSLIKNKNLFTVRIIRMRSLKLNYALINYYFPSDDLLNEFGVLYGRAWDTGKIIFSTSAGLSYVNGVIKEFFAEEDGSGFSGAYNYYYQKMQFHDIGLPFQVKMDLGARKNTNVSITAYGNLNSHYISAGLILSLRIGAVKNNP